jgi:threonylcarbamoyladenosine tRNA methylthiotransferase MtaB
MSNQEPLLRRAAPARVCLLTLGCKLNQADSEAIARDLVAAGCRVTDRPAPADAFIINTCSVTHVADRKARHLARLARRLSPEATVIVTGCYAETAGPRLAAATGADLVLGNDEKPSLAGRLLGGGCVAHSPAACAANPLRTRAFVKIQEGCNDVCSFCIVPRTRCRERSVPVEQVVNAVQVREQEGVQEVVLTGTQLGAYRPVHRTNGGDPTGGRGLIVLLRALLAGTAVPRIRLSSLQPQDVSPELLSLWEDGRLCRHFHIPLQSGSDAVLSRMRRRYTVDEFHRSLALIRERVPEAAITTDVIAGFPGESDADFEETCAFCREAAFARVHVFPYSRRKGTAATLMREQMPEAAKRARTQRLLALAQELRAGFEGRLEGRVMTVLWEEGHPGQLRRPGFPAWPLGSAEAGKPRLQGGPSGGGLIWEGLTDNYVRVFTHSDADLGNRIVPVRLRGRDELKEGLWGDLACVPRALQSCGYGKQA